MRIRFPVRSVCLLFLPALFAAAPVVARSQDFESTVLGFNVFTAWGVAAGDFDGDGDIDCAASGKSPGLIYWFETVPDEPPVQHFLYQVAGSARYITAADVDNDDDIDLILAAYGESRFIIFENVGGSPESRFVQTDLQNDAVGAWLAKVEDITGDGLNDIVTCSFGGNNVSLFQQEDGEFTEIYSVTVSNPAALYPVDLDSDDDMDILIGSISMTEEGIYWIEQVQPLQFQLQPLILEDGLRVSSLAAADLTNDNDVDLIAADFIHDRIIWWERGTNEYQEVQLPGNLEYPREVLVADFDDDGWMDIAASAQGRGIGLGSVQWWRNLGEGNFTVSIIQQGENPYDLELTDYDRDGDPDILAAHNLSGEIVLYENLLGNPAQIRGTVTALSSGQPVPDVRVRLLETGVQATTDSAGAYRMGTAVGTFTVAVEHPCWVHQSIEGVEAVAGETTDLDIQLRRPVIGLDVSSLNLIVRNSLLFIEDIPIQNFGDGDLTVEAEVSGNYANDTWLTISPPQATIDPASEQSFTVEITPDTSNSGSWDYFGNIYLHTNSCPDTALLIPVFVLVLDTPERSSGLPLTTRLHPAYPNPFNVETTIRYDLARPGNTTLDLYNIKGQQVRALVDAVVSAGSHTVGLSAGELGSGVYYLRLAAGNSFYTQKLLLLK